MRLTEFWIVRDPGPRSELADICFCTSPVGFAQYYTSVESGKAGSFAALNHVFYVGDGGLALEDAMARMASRGPTVL